MILLNEKDLRIALPPRIILTDNGAADLEKQGKVGYYTWVGYEHLGKNYRSDPKMSRLVEETARNIIAPAFAEICIEPIENVVIEDFIDSVDMFRVWVSSNKALD